MDFAEVKGQLVAEGSKGHYIITDGYWWHLERVSEINGDHHTEQLGAFYSNIEAMAAADVIDDITH